MIWLVQVNHLLSWWAAVLKNGCKEANATAWVSEQLMNCPSVKRNNWSIVSRAIITVTVEVFTHLLFQLLPGVMRCYLFMVAFTTEALAVPGAAHKGTCVSSSCTLQVLVAYERSSAAAGELKPRQKLHVTYRDYVVCSSPGTWADPQSIRAFTCVMMIIWNEFVPCPSGHKITSRVFLPETDLL